MSFAMLGVTKYLVQSPASSLSPAVDTDPIGPLNDAKSPVLARWMEGTSD